MPLTAVAAQAGCLYGVWHLWGYTVLTRLGQVVHTAVQPAAAAVELVLPLDGLAPGLYTVQAHTAVGTISRRLTIE